MPLGVKRAFSLIELLVYFAVAAVIAMVALSLFLMIRKMTSETQVSYLISRDVEQAIEIIRGELRDTALAGIRIQSSPSGVSFPSARDGDNHLKLSEFGVPAWQGQVYYGLTSGSLVRWSVAQPSDMPQAAVVPFAIPSSGTRTLLTDVVMPDIDLPGVGPDGQLHSDSDGGFRVRFLRCQLNPQKTSSSFSLSETNPGLVSMGNVSGQSSADNTGLIEVRLQIYQTSPQGKPNYLSLSLRMRPRY